ncbi:sigma-70 family RNA polymerase sigma factor [Chitinophaga pendula]|uniref:RNA polymerase sigma factor n=1 Tax=Chitinophaga TaxID=79328 RepID=UPI000BAE6C37|nr:MULTISPECIES: sigma-70 family RNA polymerase sigma factor [Chitinophaga]ASZ12215.1 RNA polymerase subunit sigma-70 [Chitinophaga sp. MD30]UCJ04755.1 sigma-70 family RNA polymerase sigma factor [Chitinophaga pendula]
MDVTRDAATFLTYIDSNKGIIYKIAHSYCKDEEGKKDLIQEIILQLWLSFPRYDETFRWTTWMYKIALNVAISFYSKERRRHVVNQPLPEQLLIFHEDATHTERHADLQYLQQFIRELREIDRAVLLLYLDGNSQQEIGHILGISATNVSTKVGRIKQQLQQKFSALQK